MDRWFESTPLQRRVSNELFRGDADGLEIIRGLNRPNGRGQDILVPPCWVVVTLFERLERYRQEAAGTWCFGDLVGLGRT